MNFIRKGLLLPTVLFGAFWAGGAQALLIDSFDVDQFVQNHNLAVSTVIDGPASGPGMIGDRTVEHTVTAGGGFGASSTVFQFGVLNLSNNSTTNSTVTLTWDFGLIDLTEGGTQEGIFLSVPNPIDEPLNIGLSVNGGAQLVTAFADGSVGNDFLIPFAGLANIGAITGATQIILEFSSPNVAWDAQIDFIETYAPPPSPPGSVSEPSPVALLGMGLAGIAWSRRSRRSR